MNVFDFADFKTSQRNPFAFLPKIAYLGNTLLEKDVEKWRQEEVHNNMKNERDEAVEELNKMRNSQSSMLENNNKLTEEAGEARETVSNLTSALKTEIARLLKEGMLA